MMNDTSVSSQLQKNRQTVILSSQHIRKNALNATANDNTPSVPTQKKIMLFVLGMVERINFAKTPIVTLGRCDRHQIMEDQLNLENYGAMERGVSRIHCRLELQDNQLIVTDLCSSNGTFVLGKRLDPNQPYTLKKGEELTLGRLPIQIIFER
jgi:pSer/pThr/pTyr-binding forkhead associated (FHA) protein